MPVVSACDMSATRQAYGTVQTLRNSIEITSATARAAYEFRFEFVDAHRCAYFRTLHIRRVCVLTRSRARDRIVGDHVWTGKNKRTCGAGFRELAAAREAVVFPNCEIGYPALRHA
jgi:hypothetical protein